MWGKRSLNFNECRGSVIERQLERGRSFLGRIYSLHALFFYITANTTNDPAQIPTGISVWPKLSLICQYQLICCQKNTWMIVKNFVSIGQARISELLLYLIPVLAPKKSVWLEFRQLSETLLVRTAHIDNCAPWRWLINASLSKLADGTWTKLKSTRQIRFYQRFLHFW